MQLLILLIHRATTFAADVGLHSNHRPHGTAQIKAAFLHEGKPE
jgi:hypothetical protein